MQEQYGGYSGRGVLDNLASLTGGDAFFPENVQALPAICSQIGLELKTQYLLGYRSQNLTADGKWRKIRIKINTENRRASLKVRAKSGYYAPTTPRVLRGGDQ
jgi:Ca-activated chloride channel family protein